MKARALLLGTVLSVLILSSAAQAQVRAKSSDAEPCCSITAIDGGKGVVTAKAKTGKVFRFNVRDGALLKTLRVGQAIRADFGAGRVSINGVAPCCNIIADPAEPAGNANAEPQEPCCGITAINAATGIVTAKELATGRIFRFEVKNATLLRSLKVGQKVFADFGSSKVRIHGSEPCCNIIGHGVN